jgi:hypothetical protein
MNGNTIRASISRKINVKATKYTVQKSFTYMADKKIRVGSNRYGITSAKIHDISNDSIPKKKEKEKGATTKQKKEKSKEKKVQLKRQKKKRLAPVE